jgi:hypothetical protein
MSKFMLSERYKLELHWFNARYDNPGVCLLSGAYFSGPALQDAVKLNNNDYIMLDFYSQYLVLVSNVFTAKLSWGEVSYKDNKIIRLSDATMSHDTELNKVPKLCNNDYLVIDTSNHEVSKHRFNLLYKTYVVNGDSELYNFRSK